MMSANNNNIHNQSDQHNGATGKQVRSEPYVPCEQMETSFTYSDVANMHRSRVVEIQQRRVNRCLFTDKRKHKDDNQDDNTGNDRKRLKFEY